MKQKMLAAGGLLLAFTSAAHAEPTIVKAARYLDVVSGKYVAPAVIVIDDGKIAAINPPAAPEGKLVDLGDLTLLPGLMDAHVHLTYDIEPGFENAPVRETAADEALRGAANARKTLLAGFTTVRNLGAGGFSDVSLMTAIDKGRVAGPRIIPAGHALGITGGHCDATGFAPGVLEIGPEEGVADGTAAFVRAARYQIKHGAKVIKICATAGVLSFEDSVGAQQMSFEEMKAVADEAHRHGVKVAAHAHGTAGIIAASNAGIDSIEHGSIITDEAAKVLKKNKTWLDSTLYLAQTINWDALPPLLAAKGRDVMPKADKSFELALKYGIKMALGTDAAVYPHGKNAGELVRHVELGQSAIEAIRSATINNAELFGTADRGRIAPGLLADIIGVDGDPLADIKTLQSVGFVMKGGEVYKGGGQ